MLSLLRTNWSCSSSLRNQNRKLHRTVYQFRPDDDSVFQCFLCHQIHSCISWKAVQILFKAPSFNFLDRGSTPIFTGANAGWKWGAGHVHHSSLRPEPLHHKLSRQKCQYHTVCTKRQLNHVWNVLLICFIIKIGQILSGYILMLCFNHNPVLSAMPQSSPQPKGEQNSTSVVAFAVGET